MYIQIRMCEHYYNTSNRSTAMTGPRPLCQQQRAIPNEWLLLLTYLKLLGKKPHLLLLIHHVTNTGERTRYSMDFMNRPH